MDSLELSVTFTTNRDLEKGLITTKKIAQGKSEVFHAKDCEDDEEYAIKTFPKNEASFSRYIREKSMICSLNHPNIIKYYPILHHNAEFDILITEYAKHGDFFGLVTMGGLTDEVLMRTYFHQLIEALEYLHSQGIAHLDLKLENLLLSKNFSLKLIDFDQSHCKDEKEIVCTGTNCYRPLEIKHKTCTNKFAADVYSAGIILYAFKTRQFPFVEIEENGTTRMISYDLFMQNNDKFWKIKAKKIGKRDSFFTSEFRELVKGMLHIDPVKRYTIKDIKESKWYNKPTFAPENLRVHMEMLWESLNKGILPIKSPKKSRAPAFFRCFGLFLCKSKVQKAKSVQKRCFKWFAFWRRGSRKNVETDNQSKDNSMAKAMSMTSFEVPLKDKDMSNLKCWNMDPVKASTEALLLTDNNDGKGNLMLVDKTPEVV